MKKLTSIILATLCALMIFSTTAFAVPPPPPVNSTPGPSENLSPEHLQQDLGNSTSLEAPSPEWGNIPSNNSTADTIDTGLQFDFSPFFQLISVHDEDTQHNVLLETLAESLVLPPETLLSIHTNQWQQSRPTRDEFMLAIMRALVFAEVNLEQVFPVVNTQNNFNDVVMEDLSEGARIGYWLVWGYQRGIIFGDGQGNLNPQQPITYYEAAALTARIQSVLLNFPINRASQSFPTTRESNSPRETVILPDDIPFWAISDYNAFLFFSFSPNQSRIDKENFSSANFLYQIIRLAPMSRYFPTHQEIPWLSQLS